MDIAAIDQVRLNFNPQGLFIINAAIGLMMLGVALELKLDDFKRILGIPLCTGLLDIDETAVDAAAADMVAGGMNAVGICCDVAREADCKAAINAILERYGGINILVNNAGITQRSAFVDTQIDVYRQVMNVNFFGSLHCTKYAIASLCWYYRRSEN